MQTGTLTFLDNGHNEWQLDIGSTILCLPASPPPANGDYEPLLEELAAEFKPFIKHITDAYINVLDSRDTPLGDNIIGTLKVASDGSITALL